MGQDMGKFPPKTPKIVFPFVNLFFTALFLFFMLWCWSQDRQFGCVVLYEMYVQSGHSDDRCIHSHNWVKYDSMHQWELYKDGSIVDDIAFSWMDCSMRSLDLHDLSLLTLVYCSWWCFYGMLMFFHVLMCYGNDVWVGR